MNMTNIEFMYNALRENQNVRAGFRLSLWGTSGEMLLSDSTGIISFKEKTDCGTIGCIAGWTVHLLTGHRIQDVEVETIAAEALGLNSDVARQLFSPNTWQHMLRRHTDHYFLNKGNLSASLQTVKDMKDWADNIEHHYCLYDGDDEPEYPYVSDYIYDKCSPDNAAAALAGLTHHPGYVNWAEAMENPKLELEKI